ncbi:hypothetical protein [Mucilaginibacter dorajii]|uniref:Uncharacterized protein n=1 Tax=Mucilaginibacter dorajii TaxID=692994 RepID=A0ABP7PFR1_9SPHI|nr:hypothetical protein [Mucilaginibacter dorajii]MCS3735409.1 hypothetical protein [Mucilaginibacter dorajii]
MKSELDLLIELLEAEKKSLELLIQEDIKEHEYLNVHHYGQALIKVNSRLYMLNCFKDPFYERENRLERMQNFYSTGEDIYLKAFWEEQLVVEKEEIRQLRKQSNTYFNDTQNIDDALFDLRDGRFAKLRLNFSHRGEPFYLDFKMEAGQILNIYTKASNLVDGDDPDDLESSQLHLFVNLGFKADIEADLLIYKWVMHGVKDVIAIKTMLSRIIYDIGYWSEEKQATLACFV